MTGRTTGAKQVRHTTKDEVDKLLQETAGLLHRRNIGGIRRDKHGNVLPDVPLPKRIRDREAEKFKDTEQVVDSAGKVAVTNHLGEKMKVDANPDLPKAKQGRGALNAIPAKVKKVEDINLQRGLKTANEKGGAHGRLQTALRTSGGKVPDEHKKHLRLLESNMQPTTDRTVMYRGVQDLRSMFGEHAGGNMVGQRFTEHGFTPGSADYETARTHVYGGMRRPDHIPAVLEMHMPKGTHAMDFGTAEQDALYQRGLTYKVISDMIQHHRRHIVVEASHSGVKPVNATEKAKPAAPTAPTELEKGVRGKAAHAAVPSTKEEHYDRYFDNNDQRAHDIYRALEHYQGEGGSYKAMQSALRSGKGTVPAEHQEMVDLLDESMKPSTKPVVVHRGVTDLRKLFPGANGDLTGTHFQDHGFLPTTTDRDIARRFTDGPDDNAVPATMDLHLPTGTRGVSMGGAEGELLFQRGMKFHVMNDSTKDGMRHLTVRGYHDEQP